MLVLTRERNQKVVVSHRGTVIGGVVLVDIRNERARLGFDFPPDYTVDRSEIHEKRTGRTVAELKAMRMDVFEAITKRHSYRGPFRDQPVPRADLSRIAQAGLQAPSATNAQTTRFVIVDDADLVRQIGRMHATNPAMQTARALIACAIDRRPEAVYEGHAFQVEDCAVAVENMLLAVTALGYATVWIDGWLRLADHAQRIGDLLGLPPEKIVRIILPIGVPAENWSQREKRPFVERVWFNHYGELGETEPGEALRT